MTDSGSGCVGWMIDDSVLVLGSRDGTRSLGAKGVESGVKGRQIRRPFHSDCDLLRRLRHRLIRQRVTVPRKSTPAKSLLLESNAVKVRLNVVILRNGLLLQTTSHPGP
jgi:hypothetical protein